MDTRLMAAAAALKAGEPFVEPIEWEAFTNCTILGQCVGIDRPWRDDVLNRWIATNGRIIVSVPFFSFTDWDQISRPQLWIREQVGRFPWSAFEDRTRWMSLSRADDLIDVIDYVQLEQLRHVELHHYGPHRPIRDNGSRTIDLYLVRFAGGGRGFVCGRDK